MKTSTQLVQYLHKWMDTVMHRSMRDWSRFVKASGLSMPQFSILMQMHYKGQTSISEISERMDITNAASSQLVDRLVHSGLLERTENPDDRRAKDLTLSPKGKAMIEQGIAERYQWIEDVVATLANEQQEIILKALPILIEASRNINEPQAS